MEDFMRQLFKGKTAKYVCILFAALLLIAEAVNAYAYYIREGAPNAQGLETREQPVPQQPEPEPDYKQMFEESLNWFPESTPPIIRAFLKNPDSDELAVLVQKYLNEVTERANRAGAKITAQNTNARGAAIDTPRRIDIVSYLDRLGRQGYRAKYFYSDLCPACQRSEPFARVISRFMPLERISAVSPQNADVLMQWRVESVPTLFLIRRDRAFKMTGEINETTLAGFISNIPQ
jgi:hypothetical protein